MKIEGIYKFFLTYPVSHIPVIDDKEALKGLVSKDKVKMEMADLDLEGREYETIPEHLYDNIFSENIIFYFKRNLTIPIINEVGLKAGAWEKPRFLAEAANLNTTPEDEPTKEEPNKEELSENKLAIYKYMEVILENFPDPLFSTDKDGSATFFNERFEKVILSKPLFRDSVTVAEKYMKELNRDLFSLYLKNNELDEKKGTDYPIIQAFVQNISLNVRVITLKNANRVIGFLYHFFEVLDKSKLMNSNGIKFPSIEDLFQMNVPLESMMSEIESNYIYQSLKKNQNNISHTALELGVPRSTLQNKIKTLNIFKKFNLEPIPMSEKKRKKRKK